MQIKSRSRELPFDKAVREERHSSGLELAEPLMLDAVTLAGARAAESEGRSQHGRSSLTRAGQRATGVIDTVASRLGIEMLTANQVPFWGALQAAGVRPTAEGHGTLFSKNVASM
ncbi:hypothetical protein [Leisingera thetidis]|uniref:hypothetical protein n=1 Tax=Leisingera thetidis TaxID=2930199 RepID=UPI0021F7EC6C|nr:hypothetical protein [Leisingera thetidis]